MTQRIYLTVSKDDQRPTTLTYREGQEDVRERDRRDFLLAGWSVDDEWSDEDRGASPTEVK